MNSGDYMNIGERIKALRENLNLTLEDVGDYIGVNKATVQRYESGNIDIKRNIAIKLSEILKTTPSYIMGWDNINSNDNNVEISTEAKKIAVLYDKASDDDKNVVNAVLEKYKKADLNDESSGKKVI